MGAGAWARAVGTTWAAGVGVGLYRGNVGRDRRVAGGGGIRDGVGVCHARGTRTAWALADSDGRARCVDSQLQS